MGEQLRLHLPPRLSGKVHHYWLLVFSCILMVAAKSLLMVLMHHDGFLSIHSVRRPKIRLRFRPPFLLFSNFLKLRAQDFLLLNFEGKGFQRLCQLYYIR